jgi:predicted membrane-bound mannosyltransferase
LVLLAGIGAQALWLARGRWPARIAFGVVGLAAIAAVYFSIQLSYFRSADPRELLVQVQTADDVPGIRDELMRLEAAYTREHGEPFVPVVDSWGGTGWPWSWYLRDVPSGYYDMSNPEAAQLGPVVLVSDPSQSGMAPRLNGYEGKKFHLRVWWVPVWGAAGPADWLLWAVSRKAWGPTPTATMDEWLYVKPEVARLAAQR